MWLQKNSPGNSRAVRKMVGVGTIEIGMSKYITCTLESYFEERKLLAGRHAMTIE